MATGNIGKIKASRVNNVPDVEAYTGEKGILFYNYANGVIRMSDGITPGGIPIPYNIASNTTIGGIKAGPGVVISNDGELYIDSANLSLSFGNFTANNNILTIVNSGQDMILQTQGNAEIQLIGNIGFYKTDGIPPTQANRYFSALEDGQVRFTVPTVDQLIGAVEIVGSTTGNIFPVVNSGVMLHVTGQKSLPSRIYNDGNDEFAAFVGRRFNGNLAVPTPVLSGQDIMRISATGYNGNTIPATASSRITFRAAENFTTGTFGGNLVLSVVPTGTTTLKDKAWVTGSGLEVDGNIAGGNLLLSTGGLISSSGLISTTANVSAGNISTTGQAIITGNVTAGNVNSYIAMPAGTTTKAPLVFTAGNILTTAVSGEANYDGRVFYATSQAQERGLIKTSQTYVLNTDYTLLNQTGVQSMFGVNAAVSSNTRYGYTISAVIYKSANNITMSYAADGTSTLALHTYETTTTASAALATLSNPSTLKNILTTGFTTPVVVTGALNGAGYYSIHVNGVINVTTGSTWNPLIAFSGLPGAGSYVAAGSSIEIYPLGAGNVTVSIGNWT